MYYQTQRMNAPSTSTQVKATGAAGLAPCRGSDVRHENGGGGTMLIT